MAPEEVEQAFITANPNLRPDNMAISCSNGELVDVRFCLAKDLSSYAICQKVARHSCQRGSILVAPGAWNLAPAKPNSPAGLSDCPGTELAVEWRDKAAEIRRLTAARTARLREWLNNPYQVCPEWHPACYKGGCLR